jgi:hypothetical protein
MCANPDPTPGRTAKGGAKEYWEGLDGNLALYLTKDALGDDLNEQCLRLTTDLDFQHMDDTSTIVLSW